MGRTGTPREVAYCALFLASDEASIVNVVNPATVVSRRTPVSRPMSVWMNTWHGYSLRYRPIDFVVKLLLVWNGLYVI